MVPQEPARRAEKEATLLEQMRRRRDEKDAVIEKKKRVGSRNKKPDKKLDEKSLTGMRNVMMRWRKDERVVHDPVEEVRNVETKEQGSQEAQEGKKEVTKPERKPVLDRWKLHEAVEKEESYEAWKLRRILPVKRKTHDDTTDLQSTENDGMHNGAYNSEMELKCVKVMKMKNNRYSSNSEDVLGGKVDHGDGGVRPVGGDGVGRPAVGVQRAQVAILSDSTVKRERFGDLSSWVKAGCAGKANKGKFER